MTMTRKVLLALLILVVVAQLVPYPPAENPPVTQEVRTTPEVRAVLSTSCFDCHSHETQWPWYSHVIPMKWFVRGHVVEGREHLNFSTWDAYSAEQAADKLDEVAEMVEEGSMPLASYLQLHPEAELSQEQADQLRDWARGLMRSYVSEESAGASGGTQLQ